MKRIQFLLLTLLLALSAFAAEKPNILWITMEDTSPHFFGCYGDKNARTPNIDRLAREGARFTNAYATGPVCSSSRSNLEIPTKRFNPWRELE